MVHSSERWLPVVGFEGRYEVSDHGHVRSVNRMVTRKDTGSQQFRPGRILKQYPGSHQYPMVSLGHGHAALVHRLVLEAFIGPCPEGMEACHANDVRDDNRLVNLRWDSKIANESDKLANSGHHYGNRTHCKNGHEFNAENTHIQVLKNGHTFRSCRECARERNRAYRKRKQGQ